MSALQARPRKTKPIMPNYLCRENYKRKHRLNRVKNRIQASLHLFIYKIPQMRNINQKFQKQN